MTAPPASPRPRRSPAELARLLRSAAAGDDAAFAEIVRRYRNLVFSVSLAAVGDPALAEDVAQETFLAAFQSLPALADPAAFPAWLRRIARRQCGRALRRKRVPTQPLEPAGDAVADPVDPAAALDGAGERRALLRALWRIPALQRETVALHHIEGLTQPEIAALLGIPVSTVNNRMHAGRLALRREFLGATARALRDTRLPARFGDRVGTIVRVRGRALDIRFEPADLPEVLEAIDLRGDAHQRHAVVEVAQRRGHGIVRCLATSAEPLAAGMRVRREEGRRVRGPVGDTRSAIAALHPPRRGRRTLLETGIKVIDLLCPIAAGGAVAVVGDAGTGKLVLVQELARRLSGLGGGVGVFTFVRTAERAWARSVAAALGVLASPPNQIFFLASDETDPPAEAADLPVDAILHLSRALAERRMYPAIDPLRSRSRLLTPAAAGRRHWAAAQAVRGAIERLRPDDPSGPGRNEPDDPTTRRAWKLQLYLSQPLFVAQPFTKVDGTWVRRRSTLRMCREILAGRHDRKPPGAFWFVGERPRPGRTRASTP